MRNKDKNRELLIKLTTSGVLAALVFVGTEIHVPTGIGYVNLGDAVILFASFILGPFAFFPAAIGSALGDLLAGYPQYIIPTFIIKGVMGLVSGYFSKKHGLTMRIIGFIIAEIIMTVGYFLFEMLPIMYGVKAALASVPFNLLQGAVAVVLGLLLSIYVPKVKKFSKS